MHRPHAAPLLSAAAVLLLFVSPLGCRKAPPPEGVPVELGQAATTDTVYGTFHSHDEILEPNLAALIERMQEYVDEGTDECFRMADLNACDLKDFCEYDRDPTDIASVAHAQVMDAPVESLVAAVLHEDLVVVYPNTFLDYSVVEETDREAFLAGDKELFSYTYTCAIDAVLDQASYYNVMQVRRIPDWDGTGHPLIVVRAYMPEPAATNLDTSTLEQQYSLEIMAPHGDGTQSLRLLSSWSGLKMGDISVSDAFGMACSNVRTNFTDMQNWVDANR